MVGIERQEYVLRRRREVRGSFSVPLMKGDVGELLGGRLFLGLGEEVVEMSSASTRPEGPTASLRNGCM